MSQPVPGAATAGSRVGDRVAGALALTRPLGPGRSDRLTAVCARTTAVALLAVVAAAVHAHHDPGVLCPLRRVTGWPCPFCGSTSVFIDAGSGRLGAALAANPMTALAVVALLVQPLWASPWRRLTRAGPTAVAVVLLLSWCWQMVRIGPWG